MENDSIVSMKSVDKIEFPDKTVTIDFVQEVENRQSKMMLLTVKNPFDMTMTYDARMFIVGREELLKTSIIPILPKLTNFEMWNDVIITLILDNWQWKTE